MTYAPVVLESGLVVWLEGEATMMMADTLAVLRSSLGARSLERSTGLNLVRNAEQRRFPDAWVLVQHPTPIRRVRELRSITASAPIFVVGEAGKADDIDHADWEAQVLGAGGDGYSLTPARQHGFISRLQAVLRRGSGQFAARGADQVELRIQDRTLLVRNRVIPLSARELTLVRYLHERAGAWSSREQIFRDVFGVPVGYDSSLIRTHVLNIRKKLGEYEWLLCTDRERGVRLLTSTGSKSAPRTGSGDASDTARTG